MEGSHLQDHNGAEYLWWTWELSWTRKSPSAVMLPSAGSLIEKGRVCRVNPQKLLLLSYCGLNTIPYTAAPTESQPQRVAVSMKGQRSVLKHVDELIVQNRWPGRILFWDYVFFEFRIKR